MGSLYKRKVISCVEERVGQAQNPGCLSTILGPCQAVHWRAPVGSWAPAGSLAVVACVAVGPALSSCIFGAWRQQPLSCYEC